MTRRADALAEKVEKSVRDVVILVEKDDRLGGHGPDDSLVMTEPAEEGEAGSDLSMMQTTCEPDGNHGVINGVKKFLTGAEGAHVGIVMARPDDGACTFLIGLPDPAIRTTRRLDAMDSSMPGGHAEVDIVEQGFREIRAFRIYDGPTQVHKGSLAKKIKRGWKASQAS